MSKTLPPMAEMVVSHIPWGAENAIRRTTLCTLTGLCDREMRKQIEIARKCEVLICNDQTGSGYYLPNDLDQIERQYRQDTARAMSILVRRKAARRILRKAGRDV